MWCLLLSRRERQETEGWASTSPQCAHTGRSAERMHEVASVSSFYKMKNSGS